MLEVFGVLVDGVVKKNCKECLEGLWLTVLIRMLLKTVAMAVAVCSFRGIEGS